jgi:hypothetical protein
MHFSLGSRPGNGSRTPGDQRTQGNKNRPVRGTRRWTAPGYARGWNMTLLSFPNRPREPTASLDRLAGQTRHVTVAQGPPIALLECLCRLGCRDMPVDACLETLFTSELLNASRSNCRIAGNLAYHPFAPVKALLNPTLSINPFRISYSCCGSVSLSRAVS